MEKVFKGKLRSGKVISDKMDKTVTVLVETKKKHSVYKKYVSTSKKYKAHDEDNVAKVGDFVEIMEVRPLSKDKRWKLRNIITTRSSVVDKQ